MKYFRILFSAAALLLAASCIDNDVPYPVVELRIAGVEGSGFTVSGISIANRTRSRAEALAQEIAAHNDLAVKREGRLLHARNERLTRVEARAEAAATGTVLRSTVTFRGRDARRQSVELER